MAIETRDWDDARYKPRNTKDCQEKNRSWTSDDMLLSRLARVLTKVEPFPNQESFSFVEPALTQQRDTPKAF